MNLLGDLLGHTKNLSNIRKKYENNRFENYGAVLQKMTITGFRGVSSLEIDFHSPVTVLSGLNGTGKSTIAQLASSAYRSPSESNYSRSYIKDHFPVSILDPKPFSDEARVLFEYATPNQDDPQKLTISRSSKGQWSGYKRQPEKNSFYIGLTHFLPKNEKKDMSVYAGSRISVEKETEVAEIVRSKLSDIIGITYEKAVLLDVTLNASSTQVASVERAGSKYSENHMGFGEGRMFYLVQALEGAPDKSLFVIEEPETSLHGHAQRRLARYFIDVAHRKRHQVLVTTHSSTIMEELERESVVYLRREPDRTVSATPGLSTYQIDTYLHESAKSNVTICVEDDTAEILVKEIFRKFDRDLLAGIDFLKVGGGQEIPKAVKIIKDSGRRVVGISDADMKHTGADSTISLPGIEAPEKEIFRDRAVQAYYADEPFRISITDLLSSVGDHHEYAQKIADVIGSNSSSVITESVRVFISGQDVEFFSDLLRFVRKEILDRK